MDLQHGGQSNLSVIYSLPCVQLGSVVASFLRTHTYQAALPWEQHLLDEPRIFIWAAFFIQARALSEAAHCEVFTDVEEASRHN